MKNLPLCYGVIPVRYNSTRFPGKPLADILGRPMFWHVHKKASSCPELYQVVLATDDERIQQTAEDLNVPVLMTRSNHVSGTDRVLEAAQMLGVPEDAVVVNIQGDEPTLDSAMLSQILRPFVDTDVQVVTMAQTIDLTTAGSPDTVKVVLDRNGNALYFSRAVIPWGERRDYLIHIGIYAFRMKTLTYFGELLPSTLEFRENLEQLRLLENGIPIRVVITKYSGHAVDRPEDLELVRSLLIERN